LKGSTVQKQAMFMMLLPVMLLGSCASPPARPSNMPEPAKWVYVVSHGWHTGIVVKREDIPVGIWPEHRDFPEAKYLEVGWGDKRFYQAPNATLSLALKAAFTATPSVLRIIGFTAPVEVYFPESDIIEVGLSLEGFERLGRFIHQTYQRDASGRPISLGRGPYGNSVFYLAVGNYHLFNTCNNWTAKALKAAGCPIAPARAITAGNVMSQTRRCGRVLRAKSKDRSQSDEATFPAEF
jgi:uncharacterized protein (TIGR02117 family)